MEKLLKHYCHHGNAFVDKLYYKNEEEYKIYPYRIAGRNFYYRRTGGISVASLEQGKGYRSPYAMQKQSTWYWAGGGNVS